jgi:hypothetical protein
VGDRAELTNASSLLPVLNAVHPLEFGATLAFELPTQVDVFPFKLADSPVMRQFVFAAKETGVDTDDPLVSNLLEVNVQALYVPINKSKYGIFRKKTAS